MNVLLLLLLAPLAAAAQTESWDGVLRSPSVAADAQVLQGSLVLGVLVITGSAPNPLPWVVEGAVVEVYTEVEVYNDPSDMPEPDPDNPFNVTGASHHTEHAVHADATARVERSSGGLFYVSSLPGGAPPTVERTIGHVEVVASDADVVWSHGDDEPDNERERSYDVSDATVLRDTDPPLQYVVRGDFMLDTKTTDWRVRDADGETVYTTGDHTALPSEEDPAGEQPGRREVRTLHVYVRGGTLTVPGNEHLDVDLYLDSVRVESEGAMLRAATGSVRAGTEEILLFGDDLEFRGRVDLMDVRAEDGVLRYRVHSGAPSVFVEGDRVDAPERAATLDDAVSDPAPASVVDGTGGADGADAALAATTVGPGPSTNGAWWFLLLAPLAWGVARPPFWVVSLSVRGGLRRYAAHHVPRFFPGRHGPAAALLGAVALLGSSRYEDAARFLEELPKDVRPAPATWHYLRAHGCAGVGDDATAVRHLDACLALASEYATEVVGNPVLRRVLEERPERYGPLLAFAGSLA